MNGKRPTCHDRSVCRFVYLFLVDFMQVSHFGQNNQTHKNCHKLSVKMKNYEFLLNENNNMHTHRIALRTFSPVFLDVLRRNKIICKKK